MAKSVKTAARAVTKKNYAPSVKPKKSGLENPHPSSPKHPPKFVIKYTSVRPTVDTLQIMTWAACYAAKHCVEMLINGKKVEWVNNQTLRADNVTIKSEQLEDIMEYEYANDEERNWQVQEPHRGAILYCIMGKTGRVPQGERSTPEALSAAKPARKVSTPRASKDGLVTVQAIAAELGVDARDCRVVLRKIKAEKPACGWAWDAATAAKMKETIAAGLKK